MKKAISWAVISGGILVGVLGLVVLDRRWGDIGESLPLWFFLFGAALIGFIPLFASMIAIRDPRRAGLLFLFSSPFFLAAFFLADIDRLRYGMVVWYDLAGYSFLAALVVFIVPGLFWLGTHWLSWPAVVSSPRPASFERRIAGFSLTGVLILALVSIGAVVLAILTPPVEIDCNKRAPISRSDPRQAVFVARVVRAVGPCEKFSGHHMCGGAIAVVQERFWGTHSTMVLLTQGFFEDGEQYLLDGIRLDGPLTRFLPIISFRPCNHSARLKDAQVDLRILRDTSSRNGVRIIGNVTRYNGRNREVARGASVVISGPVGSTKVTTDKDGVYDVTGLPPGHYEIHAEPRSERAWHTECGSSGYELKLGDVGGCTLQLD